MKNKLQFIAARPEYCPRPLNLGTCQKLTGIKERAQPVSGASWGPVTTAKLNE